MKVIILGVCCTMLSLVLNSQSSNNDTRNFNISGGVAVGGYDPVSYFVDKKAIKGNSGISYKYENVTYYFSSEKHKSLFVKAPNKYIPQYGGWCAYAMGTKGEKVEINPKTFKITNGKLYLFYNAYFTNTLTSWNKDEKNLTQKANKNWHDIIHKK